jgi:hypothetical protein
MFRPLAYSLVLAVFSFGFVAGASDPPGTADDGLLVYSWFQDKALVQNGMKGVDYAWVKPGLNLNGHVISVRKWPLPKLESESDRNKARANVFSVWFPQNLRLGLSSIGQGKLKVEGEGDIYLIGRIVACKAGSRAAKAIIGFGAGTEAATFDLALVNHQTKEILAGFHHRVASHWTSTLDTKSQDWCFAWVQTLIDVAWKPTPDVMDNPEVVAVAPTPTPEPPAAIPAAIPTATPTAAAIPTAEATKTTTTQELSANLEKLDRLHKQGLLSDDEYQTLRKQAVQKATQTP